MVEAHCCEWILSMLHYQCRDSLADVATLYLMLGFKNARTGLLCPPSNHTSQRLVTCTDLHIMALGFWARGKLG